MNDKVTPKLSKSEKEQVKQIVKDFKNNDLGFVLSFPEYGATVAVAPATYVRNDSPVPWSTAKFMRFSIAWLGEGDIFRRRTGQNEVMNSFYLDRVLTVPVTFMTEELGTWVDFDNLEEVEEVLAVYFRDYVLPTFTSRI